MTFGAIPPPKTTGSTNPSTFAHEAPPRRRKAPDRPIRALLRTKRREHFCAQNAAEKHRIDESEHFGARNALKSHFGLEKTSKHSRKQCRGTASKTTGSTNPSTFAHEAPPRRRKAPDRRIPALLRTKRRRGAEKHRIDESEHFCARSALESHFGLKKHRNIHENGVAEPRPY